jgi:dsRNA-specific ribonuclease
LKIFGDVFESLIGAVFLDSRSLDETEKILFDLIGPYIELYADLQTMSDHPRTILLQLWPQRTYTKQLRLSHETEKLDKGEKIRLTGLVKLPRRE